MGYGDDIAPSIRADPYPATLSHANRFQMLFLTFVDWDVIKLRWTLEDGSLGYLEFDADPHDSTDYVFEPAISGAKYVFTAQGCDKSEVDGSTGYCSPISDPYYATAARNTNSLKGFLTASGVDLTGETSVGAILGDKVRPVSLRNLMGV